MSYNIKDNVIYKGYQPKASDDTPKNPPKVKPIESLPSGGSAVTPPKIRVELVVEVKDK